MDAQNEYIYDKASLRLRLAALRKSIVGREEKEDAAASRIIPFLKGDVLIYASIASELSTQKIIESLLKNGDCKVYVPRTVGGRIVPLALKKSGIPDRCGNLPAECYFTDKPAEKIDVCVTPLLGINSDGYRIGYGKGCYDKFFASFPKMLKIGLCFDCQQVNFLPDKLDVPLDVCVTETKVIEYTHASDFGKV